MNLTDYDWIVLNTSAGKDSQTALRVVANLAHEQNIFSRVVAVHADLGKHEWPGTKELAQTQADYYGVPLHIVARRTAAGQPESLLEYVRRRRMWPSSTTRYCTSDFKRGPCARVITQLSRQTRARTGQKVHILNVFGFRAEESPARAMRAPLEINPPLTTKTRMVFNWLPIHDWTEEQVWADILESGCPYHPAYDLGMPRLSCSLCIFAPRGALMIAGKARPELLQEYVDLEREIGHDFQHKKPIRLIQEALARGEEPEKVDGLWNM